MWLVCGLHFWSNSNGSELLEGDWYLCDLLLHKDLIGLFEWLIYQLIVAAWRGSTVTVTIASADMDMGFQATMPAVAAISFNNNIHQLPQSHPMKIQVHKKSLQTNAEDFHLVITLDEHKFWVSHNVFSWKQLTFNLKWRSHYSICCVQGAWGQWSGVQRCFPLLATFWLWHAYLQDPWSFVTW